MLIADGVAKLVVVEDGALVWSRKLCASNVDCAAITVDSDEARQAAPSVVPHPSPTHPHPRSYGHTSDEYIISRDLHSNLP